MPHVQRGPPPPLPAAHSIRQVRPCPCRHFLRRHRHPRTRSHRRRPLAPRFGLRFDCSHHPRGSSLQTRRCLPPSHRRQVSLPAHSCHRSTCRRHHSLPRHRCRTRTTSRRASPPSFSSCQSSWAFENPQPDRAVSVAALDRDGRRLVEAAVEKLGLSASVHEGTQGGAHRRGSRRRRTRALAARRRSDSGAAFGQGVATMKTMQRRGGDAESPRTFGAAPRQRPGTPSRLDVRGDRPHGGRLGARSDRSGSACGGSTLKSRVGLPR